MGDFRKLEVWQIAKKLAVAIYRATNEASFSKDFDKERVMSGARVFLREMYNETQSVLKEANIKELTVFRGMHFETKQAAVETALIEAKTQPMSSFSAFISVADKFSNAISPTSFRVYPESKGVMMARIPADRIISCPRTGFGCLDEAEVVILGGTDKCLSSVGPGSKFIFWEDLFEEALSK